MTASGEAPAPWARQLRIAVFDYFTTTTNPAGSCHRLLLAGLCDEHEFTVFAARFDNPRPDRIRWVRVPVIERPQVLLYLTFHLLGPVVYLLHRLRTRARFDLVQMMETQQLFGKLAYVHFCHRAFLGTVGSDATGAGLRGWLRRLDHLVRAAVEPFVYRRVERLIVPSRGLAVQLEREFSGLTCIDVIPHPVHVDVSLPDGFARARELERARLGLRGDDVGAVFVALGHFERKGLPQLVEALTRTGANVKLIVVGGEKSLVTRYQRIVSELGIADRVRFVGAQADVRPFLWCADVFVLPSAYEVRSLAVLEAAAAGLPLIVTRAAGPEELVEHGNNGFVVGRDPAEIAGTLVRFAALDVDDRRAMGKRARAAARRFEPESFLASWRHVYASIAGTRPSTLLMGRRWS